MNIRTYQKKVLLHSKAVCLKIHNGKEKKRKISKSNMKAYGVGEYGIA